MRPALIVLPAALAVLPAHAEDTAVELDAGISLMAVWHYTQDGVYGGLEEEADYIVPGPTFGLRLARDTQRPWLTVSAGVRAVWFSPTTTYLEGTTTFETGDGNVDVGHDHQTEMMFGLVTADASAFLHANPGPVRVGVVLGAGARVIDLQRETVDVYFLPTTTERSEVAEHLLRVQPYLVLALRGTVDIREDMYLGLDLGLDPAMSDLRLYGEFSQVEIVSNGQYSQSWETKADLSAPIPRVGLVLGVAL